MGTLVEIAGIVVVDRGPTQVAEIADGKARLGDVVRSLEDCWSGLDSGDRGSFAKDSTFRMTCCWCFRGNSTRALRAATVNSIRYANSF